MKSNTRKEGANSNCENPLGIASIMRKLLGSFVQYVKVLLQKRFTKYLRNDITSYIADNVLPLSCQLICEIN